jgi:hypothetical protein
MSLTAGVYGAAFLAGRNQLGGASVPVPATAAAD